MPVLKLNSFKVTFFCLLLLLLAVPAAFAQKVTLNGTVSDAKTGLPISTVGVQFGNNGKKAVTSKSGTFSLPIDTVLANSTLTFSHLSYETLTLKIKPDQANFQVKLQPKNNVIPEVKITANKKLQSVKVRPETIVDYALRGNQVFVLSWENGQRKPSLIVLDQNTDTLQLHYRLPFYTESLFIDCLDNLHLLTPEKSYQLHIESDYISFNLPHNRQEFDQSIPPCLAADSTKIYFQKNVNNGLIVSFFSVDRKTDQAKRLQTVADEIVLTMQSSERRFQFFRAEASMNRTTFSAATNLTFAKKVMFEPPYIPLLKVGSQLALFDHVNGKLEVYENDSLTKITSINYHLQKGWAKEIAIDEPGQKAYALFQKNGLYELKLLNLETGETGTSYHLTNPFASKIRVHRGIVYFLYEDPEKQNRQFLYKAPLSSF